MIMETIGEFTMYNNEAHAKAGSLIAEIILNGIKDSEISINDAEFKHFLPVIFAEGNFEFLRVIAEKVYNDKRREIIDDFIDLVEKMTQEGAKELNSEGEAKINGTNRKKTNS